MSAEATAASAPDAGTWQPSESTSAAPHDSRSNHILELSPKHVLVLEQNTVLLPSLPEKKPRRTCGLPAPAPDTSSSTSIPYYNILWAELTDDATTLTIDYAEQKSNSLEVRSAQFPVPEGHPQEPITQWIELLLDRSYGAATRRKRAWVLVNPHAGPGGADALWQKQVKPIFQAARMPLTVVRTSYSGEAIKLAQELNIDDFDIAVPCSGDGLPHEVFNGLGKRPDARRALSKIAVCQVPCGSGNAMSCNLYGTHRPSLAALAIVKGLPTPFDLVSITQGGKRTLSFLSQALGLVADLDIASEPLRWMGAARFTVGFLFLAFQRRVYPCDIAVKVEIDHKEDVKKHYGEQVAQSGKSDSDSDDPAESSDAGSPKDGGDEDLGLPPLKYGTAADKLPEGWELVPHEKLGNFYCGNMAYMAPDMNFFSAALANDGMMDLVTVDGDVSPLKAISLQMSVESGEFFDSPLVSYRKLSAYRIIPRENCPKGYISIDGESFPWEPFQAEVHRGLGLTLSKKGGYEAPGPINWDTVTTTERLHA